MTYETLSIATEGGIATLTLDRPEVLNAFSVKMGGELVAAFDALDRDPQVRAVIVTGAGRGFCAGMDLLPAEGGNVFGLDESVDPFGPDSARLRDLGGLVSLRLFRMTKPVIAAINGPAVGVGATMTLPMDARILSEKARVGFVFAKLGVCMEACSSWFLPRLIGMQAALDWAMSGEIRTAAEAAATGYAAEVVAPEDLLPAATARARRYVEGTSALSVAANRRLLWSMAGASHPMEAHRADSRAMFDLSMTDGREGVTAFQEKRAPAFAGTAPADLPRGIDWDGEPDWS